MDPVIEVDNLVGGYDGQRVIDGVTFDVRPQEVLSEMTGWSDDTIRRIAITITGFFFMPIPAGSTLENYAERNNSRHRTEAGT